MGRNILSICDECEVYVFHLRGKEGDLMQKFQNTHSDHERSTRIVSDYVDEQPENYEDVTDDLAPSTPLPELDELIVGLVSDCLDNQYRAMRGSLPWERANGRRDEYIDKAKQSILDWHNKRTEEVLSEMLVDVSSPSANIDQAEMIELINLYINKLKEI